MRVVRAFYELVLEDDGVPPSAAQVAKKSGLSVATTYKHLRKGVSYGLIEHNMVNGSVYGVVGFRTFHPLALNK